MERTGPEHQSLPEIDPSEISIMIVAGEASGDKHGASLAAALRRFNPGINLNLFGAGGQEMRAAGVETLVDAREVGIIGVPEVARAIGKLYRAYRALLAAARQRRPSAVVLVDWPDFNMRLAKKLHREGFKIIYYISPQVWAWRKYRIRALRRDVNLMLVILPFEREFYKRAGLDVRYVGHPLAESVRTTASREDFCRRHGLDPARPIFALLPGSRHKEIHYHLPAMLDAAIRLRGVRLPVESIDQEQEAGSSNQISDFRFQSSDFKSQISDFRFQISNTLPATRTSHGQAAKGEAPHEEGPHEAQHGNAPQRDTQRSPRREAPQFVIPLASTVRRDDVSEPIQKARLASASRESDQIAITVVEADTYNALGHSDFAVVASGTATVEAALAGAPMVIIYRGSELNWRLIRPLIHLDAFGMVNLIAGRMIVPELMQREATGEKIAREAAAILSNPSRLSRMRDDLQRVRDLLAGDGGSAADRAAQAVLELILEPRSPDGPGL